MMETKIPDFVTTMSRIIKCIHCSKLFVNQQGLFVHEECVHGVSGMTKAAGKGIQPKKDPVGETESEIKIAVHDTLLWINSFQLFLMKSTSIGRENACTVSTSRCPIQRMGQREELTVHPFSVLSREEGTIKVHLLIGRYSYM